MLKLFSIISFWEILLQTNDNYKNRLQVVLQKAFKVTPIYMEISEWDEEKGYHMGVFLCIGQHYHGLTFDDAKKIQDIPVVTKNNKDNIEHYITNIDSKLWLFLGESKHKIQKSRTSSMQVRIRIH